MRNQFFLEESDKLVDCMVDMNNEYQKKKKNWKVAMAPAIGSLVPKSLSTYHDYCMEFAYNKT